MRLGNLRIGSEFRVMRGDGSISPVAYVVVKRGMYTVTAKRIKPSVSVYYQGFDADVEVHVERKQR